MDFFDSKWWSRVREIRLHASMSHTAASGISHPPSLRQSEKKELNIMKTQEELNALKEEVETQNK